jgi:hypothetical protein
LNQPKIELVFLIAQVRNQLGLKSLRIIHQVSRMYAKELGKQQSGRVRQVFAAAVFELRKIRLADRALQIFADRLHQFLLRHLAIQAAQVSFDHSEIADFVCDRHYSYLQSVYSKLQSNTREIESRMS